MALKMFSRAILLRDLPKHHVFADDVGTIVDRHENPEGQVGYSLEVFGLGGYATVEVAAEDLRSPAVDDLPAIDLCIAIKSGNGAEVDRLLDTGIPVEARDGWDFTLLMLAVQWQRGDIVALLLDRGANPNATCGIEMSPLDFAVNRESLSITRLLIARGAEATAETMRKALQCEIQPAQIRHLHALGVTVADPPAQSDLVYWALRDQRWEEARTLLDIGIPLPSYHGIWYWAPTARRLLDWGLKPPVVTPNWDEAHYHAQPLTPHHPLHSLGELLRNRLPDHLKTSFEPASAEDLAGLMASGCPPVMLEFYAHFAPRDESPFFFSVRDAILWNADRQARSNSDADWFIFAYRLCDGYALDKRAEAGPVSPAIFLIEEIDAVDDTSEIATNLVDFTHKLVSGMIDSTES